MTDVNADKVIRVANLQEFFHDSVGRALANQSVAIDDHTAYYVTNLLTVFARSEALYERTEEGVRIKPLAIMLSEAVDAPSSEARNSSLQRIGDVALFIAGFFSNSLAHRPVDIDYYIHMGGGAYGSLSDYVRGTARGQAFGAIFSELSHKFQDLVDVLNEVSERAQSSSDRDVVRLYDVWMKTGSRRARNLLRKLGVVPLESAHGKLTH